VLAVGIVGLLTMVVAFVVETAMGSGHGHRYLVIHSVQLVGAFLIVVFCILVAVQETKESR
jgi:hypothetical protein